MRSENNLRATDAHRIDVDLDNANYDDIDPLPANVASVCSKLLHLQNNDRDGAVAANSTVDEDAAAMRVYTLLMAAYYKQAGIEAVANLRLFPDDDDDDDEVVLLKAASTKQLKAADNQLHRSLRPSSQPADQRFPTRESA